MFSRDSNRESLKGEQDMIDTDSLHFVAYLEPRESTVKWYREVLYQLWRHGLSFATNWPQVETWEEELDYQPPLTQQPLTQRIEEAATSGELYLDAHDRHLRLSLILEPQGRPFATELDTLNTLGRFRIIYDGVFLYTDYDDPQDILPRSQQTWVAHIHWAEVCCMLLKPLYAVSYQQRDQVGEISFVDGEREHIETPLLEQKRPNLGPLLTETRLQYFSPQLLTEGEERSLQRQPYVFSEYLPTGGLMVIPRTEPFYYGFGIVNAFRKRAYEMYGQSKQEGDEADQRADRLIERVDALFDVYWKLLEG
jgi:hypothetical protein